MTNVFAENVQSLRSDREDFFGRLSEIHDELPLRSTVFSTTPTDRCTDLLVGVFRDEDIGEEFRVAQRLSIFSISIDDRTNEE